MLWCEYCSASFQSFVLRHLVIAPVRNSTAINLVPRAFPLKNGWLTEKPWGRGCIGMEIEERFGHVPFCAIALSTLPSLPRVNAYTANEKVEILLFYHKKRHMGVV